jgi:hypothetical protein
MKRNILAENMLRVKAKNLSETTKKQIVRLADIIREQEAPIDSVTAKEKLKFGVNSHILIQHPDTQNFGLIGVVGKDGSQRYTFKVKKIQYSPTFTSITIILESERPGLLNIQLEVTRNSIIVLNITPGTNLAGMIRKGSIGKQGIETRPITTSNGNIDQVKMKDWKRIISDAFKLNPAPDLKALQSQLK